MITLCYRYIYMVHWSATHVLCGAQALLVQHVRMVALEVCHRREGSGRVVEECAMLWRCGTTACRPSASRVSPWRAVAGPGWAERSRPRYSWQLPVATPAGESQSVDAWEAQLWIMMWPPARAWSLRQALALSLAWRKPMA